jgi:hypothetical protein
MLGGRREGGRKHRLWALCTVEEEEEEEEEMVVGETE